MKTDRCREWRESLGAYALGQLPDDERVGLEAHLDGCPNCRAEAESLGLVAALLPHGDPAHFGPAPAPPADLGERIAAQIGSERRSRVRRRRRRLGLTLSGATAAAAAAAVLAIFVLGSGGPAEPEQQIAFRSLPAGVHIDATLRPHAFGTEIDMYVEGIPSGTLCRVYLKGRSGSPVSAGTFRYRWGEDEAQLSAALDLSRTETIVVHAGGRTFTAPVPEAGAA
jgi:anti-sigma factor RsiW